MEIKNSIKSIINKHYKNGIIGRHQKELQSKILEYILPLCSGNVVEIGARKGETTKYFLNIAKKYDRKVLVIDPWNGEQQGNENIYQEFLKNTKEYNNLIIKRIKSEESEDILENFDYSYCFIDGLHTYGSTKNNLNIVYKTINENGIVCLDDTKMKGVIQARDEVMQENKFELIYHIEKRKQYDFLIKK